MKINFFYDLFCHLFRSRHITGRREIALVEFLSEAINLLYLRFVQEATLIYQTVHQSFIGLLINFYVFYTKENNDNQAFLRKKIENQKGK